MLFQSASPPEYIDLYERPIMSCCLIDRLKGRYILQRLADAQSWFALGENAVGEVLDFELVLVGTRKTALAQLTILRHEDRHLAIAGRKRDWKSDGAGLTHDLRHLARGQLEATIEQGKAAIAEVEQGIGRQLHTARFRRVDAGRSHERRVSVNGATEIDGIAADIHERATGEFGVQADILGPRANVERERCAHQPDLSNQSGLDLFQRPHDLWVKAVHEGFHEQHIMFARGCGYCLRILQGCGQRLLAQHMLARLQRPNRPFSMQAIGQWNIDGIDLGAIDHSVVAIVNMYTGRKGIELGGMTRISAANSDQASIG